MGKNEIKQKGMKMNRWLQHSIAFVTGCVEQMLYVRKMNTEKCLSAEAIMQNCKSRYIGCFIFCNIFENEHRSEIFITISYVSTPILCFYTDGNTVYINNAFMQNYHLMTLPKILKTQNKQPANITTFTAVFFKWFNSF